MNILNHTQQHWEKLYAAKEPHQVSWTQARPAASLSIIHSMALPKQAPIMDVGGGDSRLVDYLLDEGYENLTVLDISATALAKAQHRLEERNPTRTLDRSGCSGICAGYPIRRVA